MMKIKIYTLSWCPHCKELKEFLSEMKIPFENFDVENDDSAAEYIIKKTGQEGFPVIEIENEVLIGFDKDKLLNLLT